MDSSIYGALVRLSQPWVMRYPLIDFHGSNGNQDGDDAAAYRYTEARLSKVSEDGLLCGIKKEVVDFMPNYSETMEEPVTLPSLFPNLLCNPNTGIGVAIASNWLPHNLTEVANAIFQYMDGEEPQLIGPDFPTGGLIINGNDLPAIVKSGRGSVKVRGKYNIEKDRNIVFYEIPYGVQTENLMKQIGSACDEGKINGVSDIRNESNRKGYRLVIECSKDASIPSVLTKLFSETDLQTSISYNQVALVDKTPTELTLKQCIEIYINHNIDCIIKEANYDKNKINKRLEIIEGLLKALEDIDNIILLIKTSASSKIAKEKLINKYGFSENQAQAILDMKLSRLAGLEKLEIQNEKADLLKTIDKINAILSNPQKELKIRLMDFVKKYGDERRTEITHIEVTKEEKEIAHVEPEKCIVVLTKGGSIKRIPTASYRTQRKNGKGVKTQEDITSMILRTNTIDSLMIFSNKGKMYRLIVDNIPTGTNSSKGEKIKNLINMESDETPQVIYSIYHDSKPTFVLFMTKNGLIKKTPLEEYTKTRRKTGIDTIKLREGDSLATVTMVNEEDLLVVTKYGHVIRYNAKEVPISGRTTMGCKGIGLNNGDEVLAVLPIRDKTDNLALITEKGFGKQIPLSEFPIQNKTTKGSVYYKDVVVGASLVANDDTLLIMGDNSNICISAKDIPITSGKSTIGSILIKDNKVKAVSKI